MHTYAHIIVYIKDISVKLSARLLSKSFLVITHRNFTALASENIRYWITKSL